MGSVLGERGWDQGRGSAPPGTGIVAGLNRGETIASRRPGLIRNPYTPSSVWGSPPLATPNSLDAPCPVGTELRILPAAPVAFVGIGDPGTASASGRGDLDVQGWESQPARIVHIVLTGHHRSCHSISSWAFRDLLASEMWTLVWGCISPPSRTCFLRRCGASGTGRRATGRGECPQSHQSSHRAAGKQHLNVPSAVSSHCHDGSCQCASSLALAVFLVSLETPMGAALDFCCSLSGSSRILGAGRCWHAPVVGSWHSRAKFK